MNEQQFGNRLRQALNDAYDISPAAESRLRSARQMALARQRREVRSPSLAWAGKARGHFSTDLTHRVSALLLSGLLLLTGLAAVSFWYNARIAEEIVEIDSAVLTGELPIDAYLDKGFGAWLKHSSD